MRSLAASARARVAGCGPDSAATREQRRLPAGHRSRQRRRAPLPPRQSFWRACDQALAAGGRAGGGARAGRRGITGPPPRRDPAGPPAGQGAVGPMARGGGVGDRPASGHHRRSSVASVRVSGELRSPSGVVRSERGEPLGQLRGRDPLSPGVDAGRPPTGTWLAGAARSSSSFPGLTAEIETKRIAA
jgi:hypothetical protein